MRILDDAAAEAGAHEVAVQLETEGEPDGARVRGRRNAAPDDAAHGVPHALVRCEGGKADPSAVRSALERFNAGTEDGWRWTVDALAAYLLGELCGIALLDRREPPSGDA